MGGATAAWLATIASAAATIIALGAARTRRDRVEVAARLELASRLVLTVAALAGAWAVIRLGLAFRDQDYSLSYVSRFSRRETSSAYRIAGIWGGMEGSLLLWSALSALGAALAAWVMRGNLLHRSVRTAVSGAALTGLFATDMFLVSPFERLDIPAVRGIGLVPILEHPAMLYHPPLLYLGLVLLLVPFADAVATALTPATPGGERPFAACRRWLMAAWILLIIGMATGANWAYVELGWGGYWAWDPIENTALLPFLAATVALHLGRTPRSSPRARFGAVMLPFLLASMGTLLTRSGLTVSVHAFGEATAVGRALGGLLAGALLLAIITLIKLSGTPEGPIVASSDRRRGPGARRRGLWLSVALFSGATFAVTAATVWPLVDDGTEGATRAIDGTFYSSILTPLTIVGLLAVAVVPSLSDSDSWREVARRLVGPVVGILVFTGLALAASWPLSPTGLLIGAGGATVGGTVAGIARTWRNSRGQEAARATPLGVHAIHVGFAFLMVAVAGSTATESVSLTLAEGEAVEVSGYTMTLRAVELRERELEPTEQVVAVVDISRRGQRDNVTTLEPRRDVYVARDVVLPENALRSNPRDDIQIALRRADDDRALLDISVRPLAWWLWWSSALMVLGGVALLSQALRRVFASRRTGSLEVGAETNVPEREADASTPRLTEPEPSR